MKTQNTLNMITVGDGEKKPLVMSLFRSQMTTSPIPNSMNRSSLWRRFILIPFALAWFAVAPQTRAVCQEECDDTHNNTALGSNALDNNTTGTENTATGFAALSNNTTGIDNTAIGNLALQITTTGIDNTAVGDLALWNNTTGSDNTATGSGALTSNTTGNDNTATGLAALWLNTTGNDNTANGWSALFNNTTGDYNTATGSWALVHNTTGSDNTATGFDALGASTIGSFNTASGTEALGTNTSGGSNTAAGYASLFFNTTGSFNTAIGRGALYHNTTANNNVATGYQALNSNKTGTANTATGTQALQFDTGSFNTAAGYQALNKNTVGVQNVANGYQALLSNTSGLINTAVGTSALQNSQTGSGNIAIGFAAGTGITSGSNNIDVANTSANESSTIRIGSTNQTNTYIAGINGVTVAAGLGVIVDSSGHLGTSTSSARYKDNIQPMDKASEALFGLQPVTFRYKKELDPKAIPQFGLVAEEVEKVDPDLVARDEQGKAYSVRYEAVNAMLLNEFLKAHRTIDEQKAEIAQLKAATVNQAAAFAEQQREIAALTSQIQKVRHELQEKNPVLRLTANTRVAPVTNDPKSFPNDQ